MLTSVTTYFRDRRDSIQRNAYVAGGVYVAWKHLAARIKELRDAQVIQKLAEDSIYRRFTQNEQDIQFTIMTMLPTLHEQILEGMDVEAITAELQEMVRRKHAVEAVEAAPAEQASPELSTSSTSPTDARSENGSVSVISSVQDDASTASGLGASTTSWVDNMSTGQASHAHDPSGSGSQRNSSPESSHIGTDMSESFISNSSVSYGDVAIAHEEQPAPQTFTRSKAELWKEVKMLTLTRTLTTLYSMTLLSMLIHIQLNIISRRKYVYHVIESANNERLRENRRDRGSLLNLLSGAGIDDAYNEQDILSYSDLEDEQKRKFLTVSWWLLHVGWKDIGERVRRAVEEVFEDVGLKQKLSASELHRLLRDVRRRVEFEITFEGTERQTNFASTLLPPTDETMRHALLGGGIHPRSALMPDNTFEALLAETRAHIASGSFACVLSACLDRATDVLLTGVEQNIFGNPSPDAPTGAWEDPNAALGQEPRVRLANMLPPLARWCRVALEASPNELIDGIGALHEMHAFNAVVYTNYEDRFQPWQ
ncbi:peroxin-3 domain-containing protein [Phanerochaete sordida]|uniref:Peroxin-3 domain-containing protein n=1 Tax=Phanerochaete sordida TaxID=48140 RepID=A0A9P3GEH7_9APHY|nr:peroxin-3 domain-containing protein [Phanerochaete sordida]